MWFHISIFSCFVSLSYSLQAWQINQQYDNPALYGDMLLTPVQRSRYGNVSERVRGVSIKETVVNRWPNNVIPYELSPRYTESQKRILRDSLKAMQTMSCFRFEERTRQRDYLFIVPLDGCYSYVGRIGGRQTMSLAVDCLADYIIWHEMMHAIGFEHEHQRPDRDSFIRVDYRNVQPGQLTNFEKISPNDVDFPDTYDYKSIMHYDGYAFGRIDTTSHRRLATMIPLRRGMSLVDNMVMSRTDIHKLNRLGKCIANKQSQRKVSQSSSNQPSSSNSCIDQLNGCEEMRQKGLCNMAFYKKMLELKCPLSCGVCSKRREELIEEEGMNTQRDEIITNNDDEDIDQNSHTTDQNELTTESNFGKTDTGNTTIGCVDVKNNCAQFLAHCSNLHYEKLMIQLCPVTCGFCHKRAQMSSCMDTDSDCATFSSNGFCNNEIYSSVRKLRCAKTCGEC